MVTVTKKDFLLAKLKNFNTFITEKVPDVPKFKQTLIALSKATPEEFSAFILGHVKQHENNLDGYVDKMLAEFQVPKNEFAAEDIIKFKRYLQCFIEILS